MTTTAASFTDTFNRADGNLNGDNGWVNYGQATDSMQLIDTTVRNKYGSQQVCIARQENTFLDTADQSFTVQWTSSSAWSAGDYIAIGLGSRGISDPTWGFGAVLQLQASTFVLFIINNPHDSQISQPPGSAQSVVVTLEGGLQYTNVAQELRIRAVRWDGGIRVLAYLNEPDDGVPTVSYGHQIDHLPDEPVGATYGALVFRSTITTAESFIVGAIEGRSVPAQPTLDRPTLSEVRNQCLLRWERRNTSNNFDADIIDDFINDTQREIINRLGNSAAFMRTDETVTLTIDTNDDITLPYRVAKLVHLMDSGSNEYIPYQWYSTADDGSLKIHLQKRGSGSFRLFYERRLTDMYVDGDLALIPRRYMEALVQGALMRMAQSDSDADDIQMATSMFERAYSSMALDLQKKKQMARSVITVRPRVYPSRYARNAFVDFYGW